MRIFGLLALVIFFPIFAHTAELININTADSALLDTLPGVGSVIAGRIIEYRETNGPFTSIEEIQKVKGIGSGNTYMGISSLITVGISGSSRSSVTASSTISDASDAVTITTPSSNSGPAEYLPIPTLRIIIGDNRIVSSGADIAFTAVVYDGKGNRRNDAMVTWSFGDGMRRTGASVFHAYYDPGEYIAVVHATTPDGGDVVNEILMTVKDARIKIASVSPRGVTLTNSDSRTLDLSLWRLSSGGQEFKIPVDTKILAGRSILFPSQVTGLPAASVAVLLYPSGEMANSYPEIPAAVLAPLTQPFVSKMSSNKVQAIEPIISTKTNIQTYAEAVLAPTAATEIAAVGAAFPASPALEQKLTSAADSRVSGIFNSPWTLGFLGVMVLAGATFILF